MAKVRSRCSGDECLVAYTTLDLYFVPPVGGCVRVSACVAPVPHVRRLFLYISNVSRDSSGKGGFEAGGEETWHAIGSLWSNSLLQCAVWGVVTRKKTMIGQIKTTTCEFVP